MDVGVSLTCIIGMLLMFVFWMVYLKYASQKFEREQAIKDRQIWNSFYREKRLAQQRMRRMQ